MRTDPRCGGLRFRIRRALSRRMNSSRVRRPACVWTRTAGARGRVLVVEVEGRGAS